jgi:hypothetical protein
MADVSNLESRDEARTAEECESCAEPMFRASDDVRRSYVRGIQDFDLKPVEFSVINGRAIFEGDIALGTAEDLETLRQAVENRMSPARLLASGRMTESDAAQFHAVVQGVGITGQRFRWPGGIVPYETIDSLRDTVRRAIEHWEANTGIRFVERTPTNAGQFPNWVSFEALDGCWSFVGMQGGKQVISLGAGCGFGQAVHEIGHCIGLWHEQSREDRDRQVRINWENIESGRENNFDQHITDGDDLGGYDFDSIMHYGPTAFSKNGQPTITPLGGQQIGQRNGLSGGDTAAVRAMYPQLEPSQTWAGIQFTGTVPANSTRSWFTHSWPAYWFVVWQIVPTAPIVDGDAQLGWKIQISRQTDTLLKYHVNVTNVTGGEVSFEARFRVLGWSRNYS